MSPISGGARYGSGARKTGRPGSGSSGWPTTGSRNRESFIRGQRVASPLDTQGGSRMPELGPYGSVRGARGNSRPYRENAFEAINHGLLVGLSGTDRRSQGPCRLILDTLALATPMVDEVKRGVKDGGGIACLDALPDADRFRQGIRSVQRRLMAG